MPPNYSSNILAKLTAEILPEATRLSDENRRESIATTVWFVSLASTVLALVVTYPEKLSFLEHGSLSALVALLTLSIVSGVGYRILQLLANSAETNARLQLVGYLLGGQSDESVPIARESSWTNQTIVNALHEDFGLDYSFLLKYEVPDLEVHQIYDEVFSNWEKLDRKMMRSLADELGRYGGVDPVEIRSRLGLAKTKNSESSPPARHVALFKAAHVAMMICGGAFAAASGLVAVGFILRG